MTRKKTESQPSRLSKWLIQRIFKDEGETRLGDFMEIYGAFAEEKGRVQAGLRFWWYLFRSTPNYLKDSFCMGATMFNNYLKIALRTVKKQKGFSLITVSGLGIGMACFILICMYVSHEFSYDKYHNDADRIYRVGTRVDFGSQEVSFESASDPLVSILREKYPEVESAVRITSRRVLVDHDQNRFYESGFIYAEKEIFDIFDIPLIQGSPESAFSHGNSMIISKDMVAKYFGGDNPIGKKLNVDGRNFEITAIAHNPPSNTHLPYGFITSMKNYRVPPEEMTNWANVSALGYIKLKPDVTAEDFEKKITFIGHEYAGEYFKERGWTYTSFLRPLVSLHLQSVNVPFLYILLTVGSLILILACLNFISLSTAGASNRAKEVGLRKTMGAYKRQLVRQFIGESLVISVFAFFLSFMLVVILMPFFSSLTGRELRSADLFYLDNIIFLVFLIIFIGMASGAYPALFLSKFEPALTLKNRLFSGKRKSTLRKVFIVCQFTISIILIIGTIAVYTQIDFMKNRYLGFDKEQKIVFRAHLDNNHEAIKNEFLRHHNIIGATACSAPPGEGYSNRTTRVVGREDENWPMNDISFDHDFIPEFKMQMAAGRNFSDDMSTDAGRSCIINEAAVRHFGWSSPEEAVGKVLERGPREPENRRTIIGVVKDFHYTGLQRAIEPLVMLCEPQDFYSISLTVTTENLSETLSFIEGKWNELHLGPIFSYSFLDERFDRYYESEERVGRILAIFACLAIFLSCLGLFGLVSFTVKQRTKEIGVRKVLGASVPGILSLLSKELLKWIVISNIIAWPAAYFAVTKWLQDFAFRTHLNIWIFFLSGFTVLMIALLTVSCQTVKAATADPVDSLRYE
ncbi:MAG: ABC transporter permease [Candidatus Aminicenantes bacterium]|nr:ABC transporter permease [Candidatus Aminicenantes bacterium]